MAKVGIVFTDTPDGGFDFDFFMFEGEHNEQTPAIVNAELAGPYSCSSSNNRMQW